MRTTVALSKLSTLSALSKLWKPTGLLALLTVAACSGNAAPAPAATPPGCGMVPSERVVGLVGKNVTSTRQGSVSDLRTRHRAATCTTTNRTHPGRSLRIVARYHPKPLRLATTGCTSGQVFAGTPEKFAPACQAIIGKRHVTRLTVRWQPYVVEVTVSRLDPVWAGDAEQGLAMSRVLAQRLHVAEAAGTG